MRKKKSNLDEMQEQKLLKIGYYGFWFAYWGLCVAILVQLIIGRANLLDVLQNIASEFVIFIFLSVYATFACLRDGIWSKKSKPNLKTNIVLSLITGIAVAIILLLFGIRQQKLIDLSTGGLFYVIVAVGFVGGIVGTFILLTIFSWLYKGRVKKLEANCEKEGREL